MSDNRGGKRLLDIVSFVVETLSWGVYILDSRNSPQMKRYNKLSVVFHQQNGSYSSFSLTLVDTTLWYVVEFWEGWLSVVSGTKLAMLTAMWWNVKCPQLWIFTEVLIRIVTLSVHTSVSSLCGLFWSLDITWGTLRLSYWTIEHAQSHMGTACAVMPGADCVCHVYFTHRLLSTHKCVVRCVCVSFLGVYCYTFVQDEWWGFPVYIPQLNMPVIAVWAERPAGSILKPSA